MTLLSEKCNYDKSPQIENAIKLFALEDWVAKQVHEIGSIKLVSSNLLLSECLMDWCRRESIFFEWEKLNKNNPLKNFFYSTFPHSVKAMVWLVSYVAKYSFLRGVGVDEWKKTKNSLTIFTYTANPISEDVENNSCNRYWTKLPEELYRNNVTINWMYIHVRDSSFTKTKNIIKTFKKNNSGDNVYTILDGFISFSVIFKSIFDWVKIIWRARSIGDNIYAPKSGFNIWYMLKSDWKKSIYGTTAISNFVFFNLLESALNILPNNNHGIYLQENQGWELAMISRWRSAQHGILIGFPHSTVRFWDLRYFFDVRNYCDEKDDYSLPLPDYVAVSGDSIKNSYLHNGYPKQKLAEVEALRYLYLQDFNKITSDDCLSNKIRLLVLGDYFLENTDHQLRLLDDTLKNFNKDIDVVIKPHPVCPITLLNYPEIEKINAKISMQSLPLLFDTCDLVYTSNITSAAVDAYYAGKYIITVLDPTKLNISPFRNSEKVVFISSATELYEKLINFDRCSLSVTDPKPNNFFYLDKSLYRWKKLLLH